MWKLDILGTRYIQSVCMGHIVKTIVQQNIQRNQRHLYKQKLYPDLLTYQHQGIQYPLYLAQQEWEVWNLDALNNCQSVSNMYMRDLNPTSQQGPEEEPLNNRTLNPPSSGKYSTASHAQHVDGGWRPSWPEHTRDTDTRGKDTRQKHVLGRGCTGLIAEGSNRAVTDQGVWDAIPSNGSELQTTVSYWMDAVKQRRCLILPETLAL